jgi:membrane fusion protein, heavy metal efflux system
MSEVSSKSDPLGLDKSKNSSSVSVYFRTLAIIAIFVFGAVGAWYILSIERAVPKSAHGHGEKDAHGHGSEKGHHDHGAEKMLVKLTPTQLKNANLTIEPASSGVIRETLLINGIIQPNEEQVVAVLPRFGGVVRAVTKRLGEKVAKGEVVARIESNESLTQYDVVAPISGTVIERKGALGEFADKDKRLMVIADLTTLWVDFRVYQKDSPKLQLNQTVEVRLSPGNGPKSSQISYISPISVTDTQSLLARAVIDNKDGSFRPGLYVTGRVLISEQMVPVAIKQSAVQYIGGKPVVFVQSKEGFEGREVEFGFKDDEMIEILFGVVAGEKVVTGNSFLFRAEIGKGEASHEH